MPARCALADGQPAQAELKALSNGRFWDIDTSCDLMITEPEKVAELLLRLVAL
jgi:hypothetical protein